MIGQQLEGNLALQLGVECTKHDAHAAFTKARLHQKRADACACGQCQCVLFLHRKGGSVYTRGKRRMQERYRTGRTGTRSFNSSSQLSTTLICCVCRCSPWAEDAGTTTRI